MFRFGHLSRLLLVAAGVSGCDSPPQITEPARTPLEELVALAINEDQALGGIPFPLLVRTATGHEVIALDPAVPADKALITAIEASLEEVIAELNLPNSPVRKEKRINEVSRHFEDALLIHLNAQPDIACEIPTTLAGEHQRSGYPDLLIRHVPTGQVAYLDPKLVASGSLNSSLRTFYFTPKGETNKINRDAHHLLVGIEHDGAVGAWTFLRWHLVDLSSLTVRLKAEFQASNRDLYQTTTSDVAPEPETQP